MGETVRITLRFYGHLSRMTGSSTLAAELSPVLKEALIQLGEAIGADPSVLAGPGTTLMLNSQQTGDTPADQILLMDGDTLSFIPRIMGGLDIEDPSQAEL